MKKKYPLISALGYDQKCHMAWRMDRYTGFGLLQISRLCRGEFGDMPIDEAFAKVGMRPHQAKWHSSIVVKYNPATYKPVKV